MTQIITPELKKILFDISTKCQLTEIQAAEILNDIGELPNPSQHVIDVMIEKSNLGHSFDKTKALVEYSIYPLPQINKHD
ncbi:hypothetical protein VB796_06630 [Arcicella sp. LKC2W]|uniref:hypothetical protein n=1 Tax=Arcicella sp. LKC2W TaxID=2984198 RepID=UPI002B20966D|nr:hypothetical protein [Arcicella sp. LKC2W]MEA5458703.1 hypothetical protein [Arcicella sp. LKC2W]